MNTNCGEVSRLLKLDAYVFLGFVAGGTCVMIYFHLKEQPECESKNPRDSETLLREVQKEKENRSIPRGIGVSK
jgi:hypothetical protein